MQNCGVSYLACPACLALALTSCCLHTVAFLEVATAAAAAAAASWLACLALFAFEKAW